MRSSLGTEGSRRVRKDYYWDVFNFGHIVGFKSWLREGRTELYRKDVQEDVQVEVKRLAGDHTMPKRQQNDPKRAPYKGLPERCRWLSNICKELAWFWNTATRERCNVQKKF